MIAQIIDSGIFLYVILIAACGLSFAAIEVHPGVWMFFFMICVTIGWHGLEPDALELALKERFYGEAVGVLAAMLAILILRRFQEGANTSHAHKDK